MNNKQILAFVASIGYVALYIDSETAIGPGESAWKRDLPCLSPQQYETLAVKVHRQMTRERSTNVSPAAIQRVAKSASNPTAPRGQDRVARSTTSARRPAARRSDGRR